MTDPLERNPRLLPAVLAVLTLAAALAFSVDWHSPVRVGLVLGFLLFVPGLALTEVLDLREPLQRLVIAAPASMAVETLVAIALLYSGAFSGTAAFAVVAGLTLLALAATGRRSRRVPAAA